LDSWTHNISWSKSPTLLTDFHYPTHYTQELFIYTIVSSSIASLDSFQPTRLSIYPLPRTRIQRRQDQVQPQICNHLVAIAAFIPSVIVSPRLLVVALSSKNYWGCRSSCRPPASSFWSQLPLWAVQRSGNYQSPNIIHLNDNGRQHVYRQERRDERGVSGLH
jgi:hypothetical protein